MSRVCHKSPAGIEDVATRKITSELYCKRVRKNVPTIKIIRCKIYFVVFIFVVYANHENIFTTKISRSTVQKRFDTNKNTLEEHVQGTPAHTKL